MDLLVPQKQQPRLTKKPYIIVFLMLFSIWDPLQKDNSTFVKIIVNLLLMIMEFSMPMEILFQQNMIPVITTAKLVPDFKFWTLTMLLILTMLIIMLLAILHLLGVVWTLPVYLLMFRLILLVFKPVTCQIMTLLLWPVLQF